MQLVRRHHELFWHLGNNTSHLLDTDVSVHPPIGGGGKVADKFWQFNWRKSKITMNFLIPQSKDLLQMPILGFDDKECLLYSSSIIHLNTWLVPWLAGRIHNLHSAHVKLSKFKFSWIAEYNVTSSIKSFVKDHHNKRQHFLLSKTDLSYGKSHWVPLVWLVLHSVPHISLLKTFDSFENHFSLSNSEFVQLQKWFAHWASHFRFQFAIFFLKLSYLGLFYTFPKYPLWKYKYKWDVKIQI